MQRYSLTIIINTIGRLECLPLSFGAIAEETKGRTGVEFILVDNSPDGRVAPLFDKWQDRLPLAKYQREVKTGMVPARNAGIKIARNEIIAFVDDDALVHPGWMDGLLSTYNRFWDGQAPIVIGGPVKLTYPKEFKHPKWLNASLEKWLTCLDLGLLDRVLKHPRECLVGANFSAPKTTLARYGGFIDLGLNYCDERIIEHLVLQSNGTVVYSAKACVDHLVSLSRLTPEWFLNRHRVEGLCRQRMLQYLYPRGRFLMALRIPLFASKMLMASFGSKLAYHPASRLQAKCRASYALGCLESIQPLVANPRAQKQLTRKDLVI